MSWRVQENGSLSRRRCRRLGCLLAAWAALAGANAPAEVIEFDVLLDGRPIGTHRFELTRTGGGDETIHSRASFDVRLLGLTVYRYRHEARESWREGCLVELQATTRDGGSTLAVRGSAESGGFRLTAPAAGPPRPGCVASYAYWNRDRLLRQRELLNPQTGGFDSVRFESLGEEALGPGVTASRYRLLGENLRIDLWYSPQGQWLQLGSMAPGGRALVYRRRP